MNFPLQLSMFFAPAFPRKGRLALAVPPSFGLRVAQPTVCGLDGWLTACVCQSIFGELDTQFGWSNHVHDGLHELRVLGVRSGAHAPGMH